MNRTRLFFTLILLFAVGMIALWIPLAPRPPQPPVATILVTHQYTAVIPTGTPITPTITGVAITQWTAWIAGTATPSPTPSITPTLDERYLEKAMPTTVSP